MAFLFIWVFSAARRIRRNYPEECARHASISSESWRALLRARVGWIEVLDELEEMLITSDVGVQTTVKIIERIEVRVSKDKYMSTAELDTILEEEVAAQMVEGTEAHSPITFDLQDAPKPLVLLVVGVNGRARPHPSGNWPTDSNRQAK